jgi:hypothetical protein
MVDFHDLPAEERSYWYEKAREETGSEFFDLPPEERGYWYKRAANDAEERGWVWPD